MFASIFVEKVFHTHHRRRGVEIQGKCHSFVSISARLKLFKSFTKVLSV